MFRRSHIQQRPRQLKTFSENQRERTLRRPRQTSMRKLPKKKVYYDGTRTTKRPAKSHPNEPTPIRFTKRLSYEKTQQRRLNN